MRRNQKLPHEKVDPGKKRYVTKEFYQGSSSYCENEIRNWFCSDPRIVWLLFTAVFRSCFSCCLECMPASKSAIIKKIQDTIQSTKGKEKQP
jgi:hypothetical protein